MDKIKFLIYISIIKKSNEWVKSKRVRVTFFLNELAIVSVDVEPDTLLTGVNFPLQDVWVFIQIFRVPIHSYFSFFYGLETIRIPLPVFRSQA